MKVEEGSGCTSSVNTVPFNLRLLFFFFPLTDKSGLVKVKLNCFCSSSKLRLLGVQMACSWLEKNFLKLCSFITRF